MKDQQLFQFIKHAIKQKQKNDTSGKPRNFAQRYCQQQLVKKKLNPYNPHEKMNHLMKNFRKLDTFVDLPELICSIKKWKSNDKIDKKSSAQKQKDCTPTLKQKIKQKLGLKIQQQYLNNNQETDQVLKYLEQTTNFRSQGLKNCSQGGFQQLMARVKEELIDDLGKDTNDFFNNIGKLGQIIDKDQNSHDNYQIFCQSSLNSKVKKQFTQQLHKITTYLQIILQTQHKQKWESKMSNYKPHSRLSANKNVFINQQKKKLKKLPFLQQKNLQSKISLKKIVGNPIKECQTSTLRTSSFQVEKQGSKQNIGTYQLKQLRKKEFHSSHFCDLQQIDQKNRNSQSFFRMTSSFKLKTQANLQRFSSQPKLSNKPLYNHSQQTKQFLKNKQYVNETFTFRNRNIKQNIMNKLGNFIRQIDQEGHSNQKQNHYYNSVINKLENTINTSFAQFKQESLTCDADITTLTNYAQHFNNNRNQGMKLNFNTINPLTPSYDQYQIGTNQQTTQQNFYVDQQ